MQLKLSMTAQGTRLALTATRHDRRWIVKLPSHVYADLPAVEVKTMDWARASGHEVPPHMVVSTAELDGLPEGWCEGFPTAYAIEQFDRREDGTLIHHEDFCQALNVLPLHKYGDSGDRRFGHDGILRLVADAAGEHEARPLARRVGFVIASGNDDAHLKAWQPAGLHQRPALARAGQHVLEEVEAIQRARAQGKYWKAYTLERMPRGSERISTGSGDSCKRSISCLWCET
jgi:serine/threonine-protein kinase HipA